MLHSKFTFDSRNPNTSMNVHLLRVLRVFCLAAIMLLWYRFAAMSLLQYQCERSH